MEQYTNLDTIQKICDNMQSINDLFNSGIKVNTKPASCLITSMILLNGIRIARDDDMVTFVLVSDENSMVVVRTILTYYNKDDEIITSLLYQLNSNLRKVYNWYKSTYDENYKLNTTRLNEFLQDIISKDLRLDLRKGRRQNGII